MADGTRRSLQARRCRELKLIDASLRAPDRNATEPLGLVRSLETRVDGPSRAVLGVEGGRAGKEATRWLSPRGASSW
jgi:hypothetical protein